MKNSKTFFILLFVFVAAFLARSYFLDAPPYDQHMFRQCQTMSTIIDYHRNGIDLLRPKVNWMGYPGYLALEFPIFQAMGASIYNIVGPNIAYIRLFNIIVSLFGAFILFILARKWFGERTALYTLLFYLFFPINIVYQRGILIDPMVVAIMLASLWLLDSIFSSDKYIWQKGIILAALLAVGLPMKALYFLPFFVLLFYRLFDRGKRSEKAAVIIASAVSGAALLSWLKYADQLNASYYFSSKLTVLSHVGFDSLLKLNYYLQLGWRFMNMELTALGIAFYLISLLCLFALYKRKDAIFPPAALITAIPPIYLIVFANINHPHSYYQLPLMPFFALSAGLGLSFLGSLLPREYKNSLTALFLIAFLAGSLHVMVVNAYMFPEDDLMRFESRIKGLIEPNKHVLFLGGKMPDNRLAAKYDPKRQYKDWQCEYLYAMGASGLTDGFDSYKDGVDHFRKVYPHFQGHLDYVVFYEFLSEGKNNRALFPILKAGFSLIHKEGELLVFKRAK